MEVSTENARKKWIDFLRTANSVTPESSFIVKHVIASYYAKKLLNSAPEYYEAQPTIDVIKEKFNREINFINHNYIIDVNKIYNLIYGYVAKCRYVIYHESLSNINFKYGLPENLDTVYGEGGYSYVMSPEEFLIFLKSGSIFRDLTDSFVYASKHIKSICTENTGE